MPISEENIKQFQILYKERFGIEIAKEEALNSGLHLVSLVALIYKPIKKTTTAFENRGQISKVQ